MAAPVAALRKFGGASGSVRATTVREPRGRRRAPPLPELDEEVLDAMTSAALPPAARPVSAGGAPESAYNRGYPASGAPPGSQRFHGERFFAAAPSNSR